MTNLDVFIIIRSYFFIKIANKLGIEQAVGLINNIAVIFSLFYDVTVNLRIRRFYKKNMKIVRKDVMIKVKYLNVTYWIFVNHKNETL